MYDYFNYDYPLYRPPSEGRSQIFQITLGCSQNNCSFCGMYKTKQFKLRSVAEVRAEIEAIPVAHRGYVQRVFLADGDALIYPQVGLVEILDLLSKNFPGLTRVGIYASPNSLKSKNVADEIQPHFICAVECLSGSWVGLGPYDNGRFKPVQFIIADGAHNIFQSL